MFDLKMEVDSSNTDDYDNPGVDAVNI